MTGRWSLQGALHTLAGASSTQPGVHPSHPPLQGQVLQRKGKGLRIGSGKGAVVGKKCVIPACYASPLQRSERPSRCLTGMAMASSPSKSWAQPCVPWVTCPMRWSWRLSSNGWTWTVSATPCLSFPAHHLDPGISCSLSTPKPEWQVAASQVWFHLPAWRVEVREGVDQSDCSLCVSRKAELSVTSTGIPLNQSITVPLPPHWLPVITSEDQ